MDDNAAILQSLAEALDKAPDAVKEYLVGYAEGILAARPVQNSA